jgi:hypothetical protein
VKENAMTGENPRALYCGGCGAPLDDSSDGLDIFCGACGRGHSSIPPPPRVTDPAAIGDGAEIAVEWGAHWWPATVVERLDAGYFRVHFEGWGQAFDETVGPSRIGLIDDGVIHDAIEIFPVE